MTARTPHILVVDDDTSTREAIEEYLSEWGFAVRTAAEAMGAEREIALEAPDAIVLDVMLPGEDGLSFCRRLGARFPVLMLSALGSAGDRTLGIEIGADDYLAKPFDPRELVARLRAIMRRRFEPAGHMVFEFDGWLLDPFAYQVKDDAGHEVALTGGEFDLLHAFVTRPQQLLSREMLLHMTQGRLADRYDRSVDLSVSRLRRKLAAQGGGDFVQTVWGEGYRFGIAVDRRRR